MSRTILVLERICMGFAALSMAIIMVVVSVDAIGRYLFAVPLPWSYELVTYYLMVVIVFFAASSTFRNDDHIGVDLFYHLMSSRVRAASSIFCSLIAAVVFAIFTYGGWKTTLNYYHGGEFIPGYIAWPTWLSYLPVPIGSGLLTIRMVFHSWMLLRHGEDPHVIERLDDVTTEGAE